MAQNPSPEHEQDPLDAVMPSIPFVIPIVGAITIFTLAFIAVFMA